MDLKERALKLHSDHKGKISTNVQTPIKTKGDLTLAYTPGVAEVCKVIAEDTSKVFDYTIKGHTVGIVTDGSAVLGLGNIGAEGSIPVMEGKAALFKTFANLDAFPICLATQDASEIISIVKAISPIFGGINLEDIAAPKCFEIEESLQDLGIPVMHDDQHGTAVVTLAGLINAAKVVGKEMADLKIVISGAGAAGHACAKLLSSMVSDVLVADRKGIISNQRSALDHYKQKLAGFTNKQNFSGSLKDGLKGADVFIGVSGPNVIDASDIETMNEKAIVFALANPVPEIMPGEAKKGGAFVIATGRSDFPNQINNSLAFPGIFKGALESKAERITDKMKIEAAKALAATVANPSPEKIIPGPFDEGITEAVANAVASA